MKKFVKFVTFVVVLVLTFTACQKEKESEILLQKENSYFDTHKYRGVFSKEDLGKLLMYLMEQEIRIFLFRLI